jgi:isopenicillin-N N-acyltransferase like protein
MHRLFIVYSLFICFISSLLEAEMIKKEGGGFLEKQEELTILHLKGSPYQMGYQHGKLLKEEISRNILRFIDNPNPPEAQKSQTKAFLEALPVIVRHIPDRFLEEMKGLADGSGISFDKILLLNLFPEMFHCTGLTVADEATLDGSLYHVRVLDYAIGKDLQDTAVLIIQQPLGKVPFANVSYAGFIGSVTGMNAEKIAIGEIGGKGYGYWDGLPMSFLLRDLLERAAHMQDIKDILAQTPRTCEYYYVFSDGKTNQALGVYATASQLQFIQPGSSYALLSPPSLPLNYGSNGFNDKFFLSDYHISQTPFQTAIYNDEGMKQPLALFNRQPKDAIILMGFSYPERYPLLLGRLMPKFGQLSVEDLRQIIKTPVARSSNLHNVIFAPAALDFWIAHAGENGEPACDQPYKKVNLIQLLRSN